MEGFINTCDFFLISGKGGSVLQKLNHIIYSFLYHDFHLLIDRNFSMFIIVNFFYSFFFFFFLLMVVHLLRCSLLLQRVLNASPSPKLVFVPALA